MKFFSLCPFPLTLSTTPPDYTHGIANADLKDEERVSVTMRMSPLTKNTDNKLQGAEQGRASGRKTPTTATL